MKNLILIRHAKSDWECEIDDFDRNITLKGKENSIKIANESLKFINSDLRICSSPAKRAYETAKIIVNSWIIDIEKIELHNDLYTFDSKNLEQFVKSCSNDCKNLILFGHNGAITDFVNKFGDIYIENVPTSGFVSITFDSDSWETINKGTINKIIFPRDV